MDEVAASAVPLPEDVAHLLKTLRGRLDEILDDDPLTVLKAANELGATIAFLAPIAAKLVTRGDEIPLPRVAEALGMTEKATRSRLNHYEYLQQ
ncbi:hypothetical protein ACIRQF_07270 [Streptomyces sp. NPDC101191]|uniref:hypothetical protein n=1 Tax=Streptomyces sp. NPDC101191 TaxID=3366126 RepID=UPI00380CD84A